jgi:hypothetical protein
LFNIAQAKVVPHASIECAREGEHTALLHDVLEYRM